VSPPTVVIRRPPVNTRTAHPCVLLLSPRCAPTVHTAHSCSFRGQCCAPSTRITHPCVLLLRQLSAMRGLPLVRLVCAERCSPFSVGGGPGWPDKPSSRAGGRLRKCSPCGAVPSAGVTSCAWYVTRLCAVCCFCVHGAETAANVHPCPPSCAPVYAACVGHRHPGSVAWLGEWLTAVCGPQTLGPALMCMFSHVCTDLHRPPGVPCPKCGHWPSSCRRCTVGGRCGWISRCVALPSSMLHCTHARAGGAAAGPWAPANSES
jgi:hypothetical protein